MALRPLELLARARRLGLRPRGLGSPHFPPVPAEATVRSIRQAQAEDLPCVDVEQLEKVLPQLVGGPRGVCFLYPSRAELRAGGVGGARPRRLSALPPQLLDF